MIVSHIHALCCAVPGKAANSALISTPPNSSSLPAQHTLYYDATGAADAEDADRKREESEADFTLAADELDRYGLIISMFAGKETTHNIAYM